MANLRVDNISGTGGRNAIDGSVFFSGGKDELRSSTSSDFAFGTGAYTLEFWVKSGRPSGENGLFGSFTAGAYGIGIWHNGANLYFEERQNGYSGSNPRVTYSSFAWNEWNHLAMSRDSTSGTMRAFVNGVQVGTVTSNLRDITATSETTVGHNGAASNNGIAYISNLRLNNTQLYTAAFTPPTEKLTVVAGTVLLCCQDSDDPKQEATGKTITGHGNLDYSLRDQNLITNGNFDSSATDGWTVASGSAALGTGQSGTFGNGNHLVLTSGTMTQAFTTVIGRTYFVNAQSNGADNSFISTTTSSGDAIITDIRSSPQTGSGVRGQKSFVATQTTYYVILTGGGGGGNFDTVSVYEAESPKAPKVLPPVGVDGGVTFEGDIKINSQGHMYFPTGDTSQRGRGRGVVVAGENPSKNKSISYVEMQSGGIAKDFGDLTKNCGETKGVGSSTRGVIHLSGDDPATRDTLEYITFATASNSIDFGDLNVAWWMRAAAGNETRGIFAGGLYPGSTMKNDIDYITIATKGDATDFGNLDVAKNAAGGLASSTRMIIGGGQSPVSNPNTTNAIEYITIASTGNGTNFGDLTDIGKEVASVASSTRGVFGPRRSNPAIVNTIDYITIATLGDAVDFGDGSTARGGAASLSNSTRGAWAGGYTPSLTNSMEYVDIATTGNAKDFGDLTYNSQYCGGCSDSHGGIS